MQELSLVKSPYLSGVLLVALVTFVGCSGADTQQTAGSTPVPTAPATPAPKKTPPQTDGEFVTSSTGLQYKIVRNTDGRKPVSSDTVRVHYEGKLDDGTVFDSSYERGEPAEFGLFQVIKGWTEGLKQCPVGGEIQLIIPPELGYGSQDQGKIPPNSTLHFRVELLEIL